MGNGGTPPTSQFTDVIQNMQQELAHLKIINERLLKASEEHEGMISEFIEKSNDITIEPRELNFYVASSY